MTFTSIFPPFRMQPSSSVSPPQKVSSMDALISSLLTFIKPFSKKVWGHKENDIIKFYNSLRNYVK